MFGQYILLFFNMCTRAQENVNDEFCWIMKYLIVGLGNIGQEYWGTRHNIGFRVVNELVDAAGAAFQEERYGAVARMRVKSAELVVLKPNTFMNLSGNAVRYRLQKDALTLQQLLVVVDDLSLPFGSLRLKPKGSHGGHNGLRNIEEVLGTSEYARLRFGIGSDFQRGRQIDYVLDKFSEDELSKMPERIKQSVEMVHSFCLSGVDVTMNLFNHK
jgi:PTH1 family peptidyl-tRNA hydrolase